VVAVERGVQAHRSSLTTLGRIERYMVRQAGRHPLAVGELLVIKAARSFYATNSLTHEGLIALVQVPYVILMVAGLWLAVRDGPWRRWLAGFVGLTFLYMWIMTVAVLSIVRYLGPTLGLLIPFAAVTLVDLARRVGLRVPVPSPTAA
jgi:hypothetical protein